MPLNLSPLQYFLLGAIAGILALMIAMRAAQWRLRRKWNRPNHQPMNNWWQETRRQAGAPEEQLDRRSGWGA